MKFAIACALAGLSAAVSVDAEYRYIRNSVFDRLQSAAGTGSEDVLTSSGRTLTTNLSKHERDRTAKYLKNRLRNNVQATQARATSRLNGFNNRFSDLADTKFDANPATALFSRRTKDGTTQNGSIAFTYGCHFEPSKTYEQHFEDFYNDTKVNGVAHDSTGQVEDYLDVSNKNITGYVGVECEQKFSNTDVPTMHCEFFAKAENFYFPRRSACISGGACKAAPILQLALYYPTITGSAATTKALDPRFYDLGAILNDKTAPAAGGEGKIWTNDGSCNQPKLLEWTTTTAPAAVPVGYLNPADVNNYLVSGNPGDVTIPRYHDSHLLSIAANGAFKNLDKGTQVDSASTISPEILENSSFQIRSSVSTWTAVSTNGNYPNTNPASPNLIMPDMPPIACCRLEKWNTRTYQRYFYKAAEARDKNCYATVPATAGTLASEIQIKGGWAYNTFLFQNPTNAATGAAVTIAELWGACDLDGNLALTNVDEALAVPGAVDNFFSVY